MGVFSAATGKASHPVRELCRHEQDEQTLARRAGELPDKECVFSLETLEREYANTITFP